MHRRTHIYTHSHTHTHTHMHTHTHTDTHTAHTGLIQVHFLHCLLITRLTKLKTFDFIGILKEKMFKQFEVQKAKKILAVQSFLNEIFTTVPAYAVHRALTKAAQN